MSDIRPIRDAQGLYEERRRIAELQRLASDHAWGNGPRAYLARTTLENLWWAIGVEMRREAIGILRGAGVSIDSVGMDGPHRDDV